MINNPPEELVPESPSVVSSPERALPPRVNRSKTALLFAAIFLLSIGGGLLAYQNWRLNQQLQSLVLPNQADLVNVREDESIPREEQKLKSTLISLSLEQYLNQECLRYGDTNTSGWYLEAEKFPLTLEARSRGEYSPPSGIACVFPEFESRANGSLSLTGLNGRDFNIADASSLELGHGGPPLLGAFGELVHEEAGTKYYAYLTGSHGLSTVEDYSVEIRAMKEFTTMSGEPFYVVSSRPLVALNEARFSSTLSKFTVAFEPVTISYAGNSYQAMLGETNLYLDLPSEQQQNSNDFTSEAFQRDVSEQLGKPVSSVTILGEADNMLRGRHIFRYDSSSPESWNRVHSDVVQALVAEYGLENFEMFRALREEFEQIQAK